MIWWLWTAYPSWHPAFVHTFDVRRNDDISWLGECGWTAAIDNMNMGLKSL